MATRVFVGMSGGVDSSVTAALLVEQGFDVTGVYMKNWTQDMPGMKCPWAEDLADAKRVAVQLGIPFKVYDFQNEYRAKVVDYMLDEYKAGRTPNPDVMCNQEVKFKLFLETALEDGADMIATGHYARVRVTPEDAGQSLASDSFGANYYSVLPHSAGKAESSASDRPASSPHVVLEKAADQNKDQTYFLYRITKEALQKTLFPLGIYKKEHVRKLAQERNLATADKKDSQGICFVGSVGIRDFLSEFIQTTPGNIVEKETGRVIGRHEGAIFYTLGQRHGLSAGGGMPYYVVGKNMDSNEVYVSRNLNDETMWRGTVALQNVHWISGEAPAKNDTLHVRMRHRGSLLACSLEDDTLTLHEPERAATSGQSAVIYRGNECLGGGIVV